MHNCSWLDGVLQVGRTGRTCAGCSSDIGCDEGQQCAVPQLTTAIGQGERVKLHCKLKHLNDVSNSFVAPFFMGFGDDSSSESKPVEVGDKKIGF